MPVKCTKIESIPSAPRQLASPRQSRKTGFANSARTGLRKNGAIRCSPSSAKFWAPVPWMLEATIVLEILVHKLDEAVIIGVLLLSIPF